MLHSPVPAVMFLALPRGAFGLFPKFSTPVENTVEKRIFPLVLAQEPLFFAIFPKAKVSGWPIFRCSWAMPR